MSSDSLSAEVAGRLRGAWKVVTLTDAGEDMPREEGGEDFHFLWFTDGVIVTGDKWAAWRVPYAMNVDRTPMEMDITRDDLVHSWVQKCIFEVAGDTLRICGGGSRTSSRPSEFTSTEDDDQVLYVAERCNEPLPGDGKKGRQSI
jgi:uncharacterized protein (TIGR03067 family)